MFCKVFFHGLFQSDHFPGLGSFDPLNSCHQRLNSISINVLQFWDSFLIRDGHFVLFFQLFQGLLRLLQLSYCAFGQEPVSVWWWLQARKAKSFTKVTAIHSGRDKIRTELILRDLLREGRRRVCEFGLTLCARPHHSTLYLPSVILGQATQTPPSPHLKSWSTFSKIHNEAKTHTTTIPIFFQHCPCVLGCSQKNSAYLVH